MSAEGIKWHWNYRVIEFVDPSTNETWRAIHEVHYENGVPTHYSENPASVVWDTEEGESAPRKIIANMQEALFKPTLIEIDFTVGSDRDTS